MFHPYNSPDDSCFWDEETPMPGITEKNHVRSKIMCQLTVNWAFMLSAECAMMCYDANVDLKLLIGDWNNVDLSDMCNLMQGS